MNSDNPSTGDELVRLRELAAEYEARMTEAAALITHVRHEINNPLAALLGQAQLLLREDLSADCRTRVEKIEGLAIRIKGIVDELRSVQKPVAAINRDAGKGPG